MVAALPEMAQRNTGRIASKHIFFIKSGTEPKADQVNHRGESLLATTAAPELAALCLALALRPTVESIIIVNVKRRLIAEETTRSAVSG
jgi:hypothetical protein